MHNFYVQLGAIILKLINLGSVLGFWRIHSPTDGSLDWVVFSRCFLHCNQNQVQQDLLYFLQVIMFFFPE